MLSHPASTRRRRIAVLVTFLLVTLGLLVGPFADRAYAEGTATTFVVDATTRADGRLEVEQTMTFAAPVPAQVSQRFETRRDLVGDRRQIFTLSDIGAMAQGSVVPIEVVQQGRFTTVTVPTNGANQVTMRYTVAGAVVPTDTGTALQWRLLQGLSAQVATFAASVQIPGAFTYVDCVAGSPNTEVPCTYSAAGSEGGQVPSFRDGPRGEGEIVEVEIGFPPNTVASSANIQFVWTVGRAFSARPLPLSLALALLVLGGIALFGLHRRAGTDAAAGQAVTRVAEFVPTGAGQSEFRVLGEIRPGHVGTVADERVDPIDISATLVDLAVHGHLRITELPRSSEYAPTEWELSRLSTSSDSLLPFERELLEGITAAGPVTMSELPGRVSEVIGGVQDKLYEEVVRNGWFERRPDATRSRWTQTALGALIGAVVITIVLAAFTTFGLVGLALIALALGLMFVAQELPARTQKGAALLGGLGALRSDLLSYPTNQMPPGRELSELSEVLPYAVVLGGSDRWLDAIVATDLDDDPDPDALSWYHGPPHWHLRDLPDSLRNFLTTLSGTLFSR
ncbi:MAG TPA: hypothetical protein VIT42_12910 [Microlunatus sp.]